MLNPTLDFKANAFHCPHCGAYARQDWHNVAKGSVSERGLSFYEGFVPDLYLSFCSLCGKYALWLNDKIVYPALSAAPWPAEDMPQTVKDLFLEARNVLFASPRTACALLRLCLQGLMIYLGEGGKNMNRDVASLIGKGLPRKFRDELKAAKAIGVNAVSAGEISPFDGSETAVALFNLVNGLVEETISQRKKTRQVLIVVPTPKPLRKRQTRKRRRKRSEVIPKPTLLYR